MPDFANLVSVTTVDHPKSAGTMISVTFPQATSGNTLVLISYGGALTTVTTSGWSQFDTGFSGNIGNVAHQYFVKTSDGTETSVQGTLNGSGDNICHTVIELPGAFTPQVMSDNGRGDTLDTATNSIAQPPALTADDDWFVLGTFTVIQDSTFDPDENTWRGFGPAGELVVKTAEQDPSGQALICAIGVADVDSTGHYPAIQSAGSYQASSQYLGSGPGTVYASQVLFSNGSGQPVVTFPNPVVKANQRPGWALNNWYDIPSSGSVALFPTTPSVEPGGTMDFKVDSLDVAFTVQVFRMGWYQRDSNGAELVALLPGTQLTQAAGSSDSTLGGISFSTWTVNASWDVPADAESGYYYAMAKTSAGHEAATYFIVKDADPTGKVAVIAPTCTHHAYNDSGATTDVAGSATGRSLYQAGSDGGTANFAHRAYGVSMDRPYLTGDDRGQTYIFDAEYGQVQFYESLGYNLTYLTDLDLEDSSALDGVAGIIFVGHHEYWTEATYDTVIHALDVQGTNCMFLSSNTAGWRMRKKVGDDRFLVCYKDNGSTDDTPGFDSGTGIDPLEWTGSWRGSSAGAKSNPEIRLDNTLTGAWFTASGPLNHPYTYDTPSSSPMYRGSPSIAAGTFTDDSNSWGYEVDGANGEAGQPTNLVIIQSASFSVTTGANAAGTTYVGTGTHTGTQAIHMRSSGALVYTGGAWRVFQSCGRFRGGSPTADVQVELQQAEVSLMFDLGWAPQTLRTLRPGEDTAITDPSVGAPVGGRNAVAAAYGLTTTAPHAGAGFFGLIR